MVPESWHFCAESGKGLSNFQRQIAGRSLIHSQLIRPSGDVKKTSFLRLSRTGPIMGAMSVAVNFTEKYLTTAQAARILRVTTDTVKKYCNQTPQRIKGEKIGNGWLIPKSAVDEYLSMESDTGRPKNRRRKTG